MATVVCGGKTRKSFEMDRKWSNVSVLFSKTRPLLWAGFLAAASRHHHIVASGEQRAMALLGLGRQSAIDLALDEWAAVAEALRYGWPKVTNHMCIHL